MENEGKNVKKQQVPFSGSGHYMIKDLTLEGKRSKRQSVILAIGRRCSRRSGVGKVGEGSKGNYNLEWDRGSE